ncbi:hypothetical protein MTR_6g059370 [Medicago truncatula]|uniref:Uncharacterized protein n=1 Tax=Medicago truncatula TaxID=3880 RepID=G7KMG5_MEDTR|nr:hypothetical protein MTR_6g059370 [Medicago truncatula]
MGGGGGGGKVCFLSREKGTLMVNQTPRQTNPTSRQTVALQRGTPPHVFRTLTDVTLSGLKDQLDQINRQLNHRDTRRVDDLEYRCPSTDSVGTVRFGRMNLGNDDDVRTMFSIFG